MGTIIISVFLKQKILLKPFFNVTFILTSVYDLFLQPRPTFLSSRSASKGPQPGTANSSYSDSKLVRFSNSEFCPCLTVTNVSIISFRLLNLSLHLLQSSDKVCFAWNLWVSWGLYCIALHVTVFYAVLLVLGDVRGELVFVWWTATALFAATGFRLLFYACVRPSTVSLPKKQQHQQCLEQTTV